MASNPPSFLFLTQQSCGICKLSCSDNSLILCRLPHTHAHTHQDTLTYTQIYACMHIHTHTHTHTYTHTHTHTHTYTHTHTPRHTYIHTNVASCYNLQILLPPLPFHFLLFSAYSSVVIHQMCTLEKQSITIFIITTQVHHLLDQMAADVDPSPYLNLNTEQCKFP